MDEGRERRPLREHDQAAQQDHHQEAREVRERRIEQPQGVRDVEFPERLQARASSQPRRGRGPFADTIEADSPGP